MPFLIIAFLVLVFAVALIVAVAILATVLAGAGGVSAIVYAVIKSFKNE